jgi:hypothetical protein
MLQTEVARDMVHTGSRRKDIDRTVVSLHEV